MKTIAPPSRAPAAVPRSSTRPNRSLQLWLAPAVIIITLFFVLRADSAHIAWALRLSQEGSAPPQLESASPTGHVYGQRHYLGTAQRGETYRWIAATQSAVTEGFGSLSTYDADTLPTGRPHLAPRIYVAWLATIAGTINLVTDTPLPQAVERVALWEPLVTHGLIFVGLVVFVWRRFGGLPAACAALFFALYPPLLSQFLPGVLSADSWSLMLATYVIALSLPHSRAGSAEGAFTLGSALAAAASLWLNPVFGFPAVLITVAVGFARAQRGAEPTRHLRWALLGAALVTFGWMIDQAPWDVAAGELRSIHPWYALAWLSLGIALEAARLARQPHRPRRRALGLALVAAMLLMPLVYTQLLHGFRGWAQSTVMLRRFASTEDSPIYAHAFAWLRQASFIEVTLLSAPLLAAVGFLCVHLPRARGDAEQMRPMIALAIPLAALIVLFAFHVRWLAPASLMAALILLHVAATSGQLVRRVLLGTSLGFGFVLFAWSQSLPDAFRSPPKTDQPSVADLEALVYRHFSHWLATRAAGEELRVLAPPALSDSLVYHGGARVLLSSAWESHPGHVAASRILSSPESTEAEAVIESLGLTHLVITSWDRVFPLLVKQPLEADRDTLHDRLQRWVIPRYLRPLSYRLPPTPGFAAEKLAVFEIVPPQDEALALSRLAEYFLEVDRPEPARAVAQALAGAFLQEPNATMARALVAEATGDRPAFQAELERLVAHVNAGLVPMDLDRQIVRAIVLALGRRHDLARPEIESAIKLLSPESLRQLTPRQVFQLRRLLELYRLEFTTPELSALAQALSAEYRL
jgi:hypothetical protein